MYGLYEISAYTFSLAFERICFQYKSPSTVARKSSVAFCLARSRRLMIVTVGTFRYIHNLVPNVGNSRPSAIRLASDSAAASFLVDCVAIVTEIKSKILKWWLVIFSWRQQTNDIGLAYCSQFCCYDIVFSLLLLYGGIRPRPYVGVDRGGGGAGARGGGGGDSQD